MESKMTKNTSCNFCMNVINEQTVGNVALIKDDKFISEFEQAIGKRRVRPVWKDSEGMNCAVACVSCVQKYLIAMQKGNIIPV